MLNFSENVIFNWSIIDVEISLIEGGKWYTFLIECENSFIFIGGGKSSILFIGGGKSSILFIWGGKSSTLLTGDGKSLIEELCGNLFVLVLLLLTK